jgi:hypothetical protein
MVSLEEIWLVYSCLVGAPGLFGCCLLIAWMNCDAIYSFLAQSYLGGSSMAG